MSDKSAHEAAPVSFGARLAGSQSFGVLFREGMALVERLPGVEGVIVSDRNEVLVSSGLKDRLTVLAKPTDGL